jgi:hypothetical protein
VDDQTAGNMLQLSSNEPAKLMESALGYAGKADDITIKPLALAGCWQATAFATFVATSQGPWQAAPPVATF